MAICGPKLSACCSLLSVWGVIQLGIMGVLFYFKSVALLEDIPLSVYDGNITDVDKELQDFYDEVDDAYIQTAYHCWIAAGIYVGSFLIATQQWYMNQRSSND